MQFASPYFLWLLAVIPLVVVYYVWRTRQGGASIQVSTIDGVAEAPRTVRYYLRHLPFALRCAAVALLIVALARPQSVDEGSTSNTEGIDIVLAIDISTSMLAQDLQPDRIQAAKQVAGNFITDRPGDRIGLVAFAGEAFTQSPLTTDQGTLQTLLGRLRSGVVEDGAQPETCTYCRGTGTVRTQQNFMGMTMQSQQPCPKCGGAGKIIKDPCQTCKGKGKVRHTKTLKVSVPAGIDNGQSFRVREEGNVGSNGGPNGDLLVTVSVRKHPLFTRDGANVLCQMPISFTQAALGATIEVPTLDGKVRYNIPEGTQTGTTFRLRGKGIPYVGYKTRGDQFVTVVVETPTKLTKEQKELLRKLENGGEDTQPKKKGFFEKLKEDME